MDARTDIDRVAGVEADLLGRDAADRVVDRFDALSRPLPAVFDAELRVHHLIGDQARIVDLENNPASTIALYSSRIAADTACWYSSWVR